MIRFRRKTGPATLAVLTGLSLVLTFGTEGAQAKGGGGGGTAKPPKGAIAPFVTPTLPDPAFSVNPAQIHGFDVTGFIQEATVDKADNNGVDPRCPGVGANPSRFGGTVTLNQVKIVVPCNLVIQMPANTFTWADFINGGPSLVMKDSPFPSFEIRAVGNIIDAHPDANNVPVSSKHIAALMYASQQSANSGTGVITEFDYANGIIKIDNADAGSAIIQINDPKTDSGTGRHSAGQTPDGRFSVDQANPTIHSGTGYPMCIPRTDPTEVPGPGAGDDPLCPQKNRPARKTTRVNGADVPAATSCRNFSIAGVVPPASGELSPTPAGGYCTQFVMPPANTAPSAAYPNPADPRQQAPFEVGDFISFSGTMMKGRRGLPDYISAHTIEDNVGIYTQPGTQPSYIAIGEFGVGTADPLATAVSGVAQETQDRIFLEASTTDVKTPVDIYVMDVDRDTGAVRNRWTTPFEMTGENQAGDPSGGITTQNSGPQPQRARIRATKAPAGLLSQASRTIRVVQRSLCSPQAQADQPRLDACLANAPVVANGLQAGQYFAPVFQYIFPENVKPGDSIVPKDFWHLPFLRFGEGAAVAQTPVGPSVGALDPAPW